MTKQAWPPGEYTTKPSVSWRNRTNIISPEGNVIGIIKGEALAECFARAASGDPEIPRDHPLVLTVKNILGLTLASCPPSEYPQLIITIQDLAKKALASVREDGG